MTPATFPCGRPLPNLLVLAILFIAGLSFAGAKAQDEGPPPVRVGASAICLEIVEHEPVEPGEVFSADEERLLCWTRIENGAGTEIVHAWIHEGTTRARVTLPVRSNRWRTFSSKRLLPAWKGRWEVKIMTPDGAVLDSVPFTVQ